MSPFRHFLWTLRLAWLRWRCERLIDAAARAAGRFRSAEIACLGPSDLAALRLACHRAAQAADDALARFDAEEAWEPRQ